VIDNISAGGTTVGNVNSTLVSVSTNDGAPTQTANTAVMEPVNAQVHNPDLHEAQALSNESGAVDVHIYPVPATTSLTIDLGETTEADVIIMNMIGRQVVSTHCSCQTVKVDVSNLSAGTYFVSVKVGNETITRKVQIARS
jgi:hypothetical protein